jgi:hypothetical protein
MVGRRGLHWPTVERTTTATAVASERSSAGARAKYAADRRSPRGKKTGKTNKKRENGTLSDGDDG